MFHFSFVSVGENRRYKIAGSKENPKTTSSCNGPTKHTKDLIKLRSNL